MTENQRPSANISRLAANTIAFEESHKETHGGSAQRATFVLGSGRATEAICVGMGPSSTPHHHYATQLGVSLGAPFQVRSRAGEPYTEQQSFIVGPHVPHQIETTGMSSFVLWSEARVLADLARSLRITSACAIPTLPERLLDALAPALLASGGHLPDQQSGQALLTHVHTSLIGPIWNDVSDDPRIAAALSLVTPQFLVEHPQPITALATRVHLSPSRFRHLFRREMGMSVQSYLRWQRLVAALRASADGMSLTEAAYKAGFADSAHLTRVCRATFGLAPSRIFKNSHEVQVFPGVGR